MSDSGALRQHSCLETLARSGRTVWLVCSERPGDYQPWTSGRSSMIGKLRSWFSTLDRAEGQVGGQDYRVIGGCGDWSIVPVPRNGAAEATGNVVVPRPFMSFGHSLIDQSWPGSFGTRPAV